jgi:protein-disulfide isomerase
VKEYDGKVRVVYKNMVVHPPALPAHLAGCAAAMQGKFIEFKDEWWEKAYKTRKIDDAEIQAIAKDIGLNMAKFNADRAGDACKQHLQADSTELEKFHVNATPTFFINGTYVGGALPKENFKQMIDDKLKAAEASGVPASEYYDQEIMDKGEKQFRSQMDPKPN